jgi:hypothetical protein
MELEKAKGLLRIREPPPAPTPNREIIPPQTISPAFLIPIKPSTFYKHAILAFRGDGEPQIIIRVYYGGWYGSYIGVPGSQARIVTVANTTVELIADNTDSSYSRRTPTIEILSLDWS